MEKKSYKIEGLEVVWEPGKCIHSRICAHGLPRVFNPRRKPWIDLSQAEIEEIKNQVNACPSGALSLAQNDIIMENTNELEVKVAENGPLLVMGNLCVIDAAGNKEHKEKMTAFCRCGASQNKPYCDGHHKKIDFKA